MTIDWMKEWLAENGAVYTENAVRVVILLLVGSVLIKWAVALVRKAVFKAYKRNPLISGLAVSVVSKTLWALLLMMVATRLGVDIAPLLAGVGVTGFVVGFAFQDSLANLAAGVMIALNEPFAVGDAVTVAGVTGVVQEVSMMATIVRDDGNNRVVIPNKAAWGGVITNRTRKLG